MTIVSLINETDFEKNFVISLFQPWQYGWHRKELPWLLLQVCGQESQVCLGASVPIQGEVTISEAIYYLMFWYNTVFKIGFYNNNKKQSNYYTKYY